MADLQVKRPYMALVENMVLANHYLDKIIAFRCHEKCQTQSDSKLECNCGAKKNNENLSKAKDYLNVTHLVS